MKKIFENWKRFALKESEYRMDHQPADPEDAAPIYDLTMNGVYPDDVYGPNGPSWYGTGDGTDRDAWNKVMSLKDKPNAFVTIFRAVPKGVTQINSGDWVTITKQYAIDHGEGMNEEYDVISKRVQAEKIYTDGNSILEWGFWM